MRHSRIDHHANATHSHAHEPHGHHAAKSSRGKNENDMSEDDEGAETREVVRTMVKKRARSRANSDDEVCFSLSSSTRIIPN